MMGLKIENIDGDGDEDGTYLVGLIGIPFPPYRPRNFIEIEVSSCCCCEIDVRCLL